MRLVPCLKALILAVFPFLEEEGNEFFDRAASILDKLSKATRPDVFYASLWKAISESKHCRISAVTFLLKKMPRYDELLF
jgi:Dopey, N-terminal